MPIFHAETIIFEKRHGKIGLTVSCNEKITQDHTTIDFCNFPYKL